MSMNAKQAKITGAHPNTGKKHTKSATLKKNTGFTLCTGDYPGYLGGPNIDGTGAFSFPVFPGACADLAADTEPIGSFSGTCTKNPYEGVSVTLYRQANTNGGSTIDTVGGPNNDGCFLGVCGYLPAGIPQFRDFGIGAIPPGVSSGLIQTVLNGICAIASPLFTADKESQCSAALRLKGTTSPRNKYPGCVSGSIGWAALCVCSPCGRIMMDSILTSSIYTHPSDLSSNLTTRPKLRTSLLYVRGR